MESNNDKIEISRRTLSKVLYTVGAILGVILIISAFWELFDTLGSGLYDLKDVWGRIGLLMVFNPLMAGIGLLCVSIAGLILIRK
jgi:hypothetical protein